MNIFDIGQNILLEQEDSKIMILKKAITKRIPITINYVGPEGEVESGQRIDIEPIVMGTNSQSGNLVIWAYVFKGVSKKGLPNWKMFRVDRIRSAQFNLSAKQFQLGSLPGYEKGKAPNAMKSLSSVITFSPYWYEDQFKKPLPLQAPVPEPTIPTPEVEPEPIQNIPTQIPTPVQPIAPPETAPIPATGDISGYIYNILNNRMKDVNGEKTLSRADYNDILRDIYNKKEDEWKVYQRKLQGNVKPGEGTRYKFRKDSKNEIDNFINRDNIKISDNPINEFHSRRLRMLDLINS
jgi:hypothetical protein